MTETSPLSNIQKWMQSTLLNPYDDHDESIKQLIKPSKRLTAAQHLGIYQRSYVARLRECMGKQFEALEYALEKNLFIQFADQYLQSYPSQSYSLMDLGKHFPEYLTETRPDKHSKVKEEWPDFLIELAHFEYNLHVIFDENNNETYTSVYPETADDKLILTPVCHLFQYKFPVSQYYQAFKRNEQPPLPYSQDSWCVLFRNNYKIGLLGLGPWQYRLLIAFQKNRNVSKSLKMVASSSKKTLEEVSFFWQEWKKTWIQNGLLVAITG